MSEPRDRTYIWHIQDAIARIEGYLVGVGRDDFLEKPLVQDGVLHQLQIIGEAAKRLSRSFREETAEIPWVDIAGMRDKIVHDYLGVDLDIVWQTAVRDIPALKRQIEALKW